MQSGPAIIVEVNFFGKVGRQGVFYLLPSLGLFWFVEISIDATSLSTFLHVLTVDVTDSAEKPRQILLQNRKRLLHILKDCNYDKVLVYVALSSECGENEITFAKYFLGFFLHGHF